MTESWKTRLEARLQELGMDMKTASLASGHGATFVRDMLKRGKTPSIDAFIALARILNVSPTWLLEGDHSEATWATRRIKVRQYVEAGFFSESLIWDHDDQYEVAIPDDPALASLTLHGAEVRGPSMNRRYPEKTVLIFTDYFQTGGDLEVGKRYIVERERPDGFREATVKTLSRDSEGQFWLVPESDDPRFASIPIDGDEGDTVRIVGRVRFSVQRE